MTDRQNLAASQQELVRALVAGGAPPYGFDEGRVRAQAHALLLKRRRGIERAVPEVVSALGESFAAKFTEWAGANPPRTDSCTHDDAAAFAAWVLPASGGTGRRSWRRSRTAAARRIPP